MDKTIQIVLVAIVVIATAAIVLLILSGEASDFSDIISNQTDSSEQDFDEARHGVCGDITSYQECRDEADHCEPDGTPFGDGWECLPA